MQLRDTFFVSHSHLAHHQNPAHSEPRKSEVDIHLDHHRCDRQAIHMERKMEKAFIVDLAL